MHLGEQRATSYLKRLCPGIRPGVQQGLDTLNVTLLGSHEQWRRAIRQPRVAVDPQLQKPLEALDMAILSSKVDRTETWQRRGNAV